MTERMTGAGNGLFGLLALGLILVLMGVPFVGMAVMAAMLVCRELSRGLPLALGTLAVVYLISDFSGAFIAAAGAGVLALTLRAGRSFTASVSSAAAAAALASIAGTALFPEYSLLSSENVETLVRLYGSAGMSPSEIALVMEVLSYLLPALLAVWAVTGTVTASAAARLICRRNAYRTDFLEGEPLRLGLLPAWILIAALALNLSGALPAAVRQASVNVSLFMVVPYTAIGLSVCRELLRRYPGVFLVLAMGIIFPPVAIGVLSVTGMLDTWLDFRTRIERSNERKEE
ncbi:MAG: hypothetical protein AVO35_01425 [Candidatus Aegiribacteria sp. MLS_C]|nr:MAG: hypothetical protein AVO35_01425 [Candidatus Aegiribacteria sp. MLS_C]